MNLLSLILVASWGIFGLRLAHAIFAGRLQAVFSRPIWLQVFLGLISFTLFGEEAERLLDSLFQDKPVTLYVKSIALLGMLYLYYLTLHDIHPHAVRYRYLHSLGPWVILIFSVIFGYYFLFPQLPLTTFRVLSMTFRDTALSIFIVGAFLPSSWWFWQHEQVGSMRLKHATSMIACLCYLIVVLSRFEAMRLIFLGQPEAVNPLFQSIRPLMSIVAVCFLVMLIPRRLLKLGFYPARLWIYWRLKRIEKRVCELGAVRHLQSENSNLILSPQDLELAIYRSLIFVLDYHPSMRTTPEGNTLYLQIQQVICAQQPYRDLVNEIIKLL